MLHNDMLTHLSIALENLSRTIPPIDEDQKVSLRHVPFNGTTLFGGKLAKLQKVNTEHASALTVFTTPAAPPPTYAPKPYPGSGRSLKRVCYSQRRDGRDKDRDRSTPSVTITKLPKAGDGQSTVTVTVP